MWRRDKKRLEGLLTEPAPRMYHATTVSTRRERFMHDLSSCVNKARRPVRSCELLSRALGGSQPESALSSCYSRQALRVFLSGAASPNFQRFLAFFFGCVYFSSPKCTSDFHPRLHFNLRILLCPLVLRPCLPFGLIFVLTPFLPVPWFLPASRYLIHCLA